MHALNYPLLDCIISLFSINYYNIDVFVTSSRNFTGKIVNIFRNKFLVRNVSRYMEFCTQFTHRRCGDVHFSLIYVVLVYLPF